MKIKSTVALSMALLMGLSAVSYADTATAPSATTTTSSQANVVATKTAIDFNKAIENMLLKNNEILNLQGQIKLQDEVIAEADTQAKRYKLTLGTISDDQMDEARIVYLTPIEARNTKKQLERDLEDKKFDLRAKVLKHYIDWKTYEKELALANEAVSIQQKEFDNQSLQYKLGKVTTKQLATATSNLKTAKSDVNKVLRKMDLLLLDFNITINNTYKFVSVPDETTIASILQVTTQTYTEAYLNQIIAANLKYDAQLAKIDEALPIIEEQKRLDHVYTTTGANHKEYDKKIQENRDSRKSRELAVEYQVYSDYYAMKGLESDIESATQSLDLVKMQYDIVTLQVKLGRATQLDLNKAKKDIEAANHKIEVAKFELAKANDAFIKNLNKK